MDYNKVTVSNVEYSILRYNNFCKLKIRLQIWQDNFIILENLYLHLELPLRYSHRWTVTLTRCKVRNVWRYWHNSDVTDIIWYQWWHHTHRAYGLKIKIRKKPWWQMYRKPKWSLMFSKLNCCKKLIFLRFLVQENKVILETSITNLNSCKCKVCVRL